MIGHEGGQMLRWGVGVAVLGGRCRVLLQVIAMPLLLLLGLLLLLLLGLLLLLLAWMVMRGLGLWLLTGQHLPAHGRGIDRNGLGLCPAGRHAALPGVEKVLHMGVLLLLLLLLLLMLLLLLVMVLMMLLSSALLHGLDVGGGGGQVLALEGGGGQGGRTGPNLALGWWQHVGGQSLLLWGVGHGRPVVEESGGVVVSIHGVVVI